DERAVATQVSRLLRERFGLGVDADRVSVAENPVELVEIADDLPDDSQAVAEPPPVESAFSENISENVSETRLVNLPGPRINTRPSIAKMHLVSSGLDVSASVTLSASTGTATGEARGLASQSGVHRAVAMATLRAVEQLVGEGIRVELEHLEITPMGSTE